MIRFSALYPNREGTTFDMAYYCNRHIPLVQRLLGETLKAVSVEQGVGGEAAGSAPPFLASGHLTFESLAAFQTAFAAHAAEIIADVPNYTNSQPIIQIGELKL
jgi:uncharacterized protein (TIGR02118 family)